jgi:hypothetical protein
MSHRWITTEQEYIELVSSFAKLHTQTTKILETGYTNHADDKWDEMNPDLEVTPKATLTTCFDDAEGAHEAKDVSEVIICSSCFNWLQVLAYESSKENGGNNSKKFEDNFACIEAMKLFWKGFLEEMWENLIFETKEDEQIIKEVFHLDL